MSLRPKKLWKSTIVIWSEFNPNTVELSQLAREAEVGAAYCSSYQADYVEVNKDPDWEETEFFGEDPEEEE